MTIHCFGVARRVATTCAQWAALTTLAVAAQGVHAQNVMVYGEGQTPSAQDVADILSRGAAEAIKQRGQVSGGLGSPFAALEQKPTANVKEASVLSIPVQFGFDSAELSAQSKAQIDAIAEGIRLTEGTVKVVVEGHTDAKGRATYNDRLSLRRAAAVRDYLVNQGHLQAKLLMVEGKGAQKLLDKADPYSPRNRRVQFRAG